MLTLGEALLARSQCAASAGARSVCPVNDVNAIMVYLLYFGVWISLAWGSCSAGCDELRWTFFSPRLFNQLCPSLFGALFFCLCHTAFSGFSFIPSCRLVCSGAVFFPASSDIYFFKLWKHTALAGNC